MKFIEYSCDRCKAKFSQETYEKGECISFTFTKFPYELAKEGTAAKDLCSKCSMELLRFWKGVI